MILPPLILLLLLLLIWLHYCYQTDTTSRPILLLSLPTTNAEHLPVAGAIMPFLTGVDDKSLKVDVVVEQLETVFQQVAFIAQVAHCCTQ